MNPLDAVRHCLMEHELVGEDAANFGSPDEIMLVSAGPVSHLSRFSLLCGPSTKGSSFDNRRENKYLQQILIHLWLERLIWPPICHLHFIERRGTVHLGNLMCPSRVRRFQLD